MPIEVSLAQIQARGYTRESFHNAVEDYRAARARHSTTIGEAAPAPEIPGIERCVVRIPPNADNDEMFVTDYTIVDDLPPPPPPPTLDQKKAAHVGAVNHLMQQAFDDTIPRLKLQLWTLTYADYAEIAEADRTAGQKVFMKQHEARMKHEKGIARHTAKLLAQIDDLTEATVDAWKPEPFDVLF